MSFMFPFFQISVHTSFFFKCSHNHLARISSKFQKLSYYYLIYLLVGVDLASLENVLAIIKVGLLTWKSWIASFLSLTGVLLFEFDGLPCLVMLYMDLSQLSPMLYLLSQIFYAVSFVWLEFFSSTSLSLLSYCSVACLFCCWVVAFGIIFLPCRLLNIVYHRSSLFWNDQVWPVKQ